MLLEWVLEVLDEDMVVIGWGEDGEDDEDDEDGWRRLNQENILGTLLLPKEVGLDGVDDDGDWGLVGLLSS